MTSLDPFQPLTYPLVYLFILRLLVRPYNSLFSFYVQTSSTLDELYQPSVRLLPLTTFYNNPSIG